MVCGSTERENLVFHHGIKGACIAHLPCSAGFVREHMPNVPCEIGVFCFFVPSNVSMEVLRMLTGVANMSVCCLFSPDITTRPSISTFQCFDGAYTIQHLAEET